jgi:hypothetical protein
MEDRQRQQQQQAEQSQSPDQRRRDALFFVEPAATRTILDPRTQFPNALSQYRQSQLLLPEHSYYYYPDHYQDGHRPPSYDATATHSKGFLEWLVHIVYWLMQLLCLLLLSGLSYGIFYERSMPAPHVVKELHFDYTVMARHNPTTTMTMEVTNDAANSADAMRRVDSYNPYAIFIPSFQHHRRDTTNPLLLPTATATVDLWARHDGSWNALQESVVGLPVSTNTKLTPNQAYSMEIILHLPESNANKNAGMFGVITDLYANTKEETTTKESDTTSSTPSKKQGDYKQRRNSKASSLTPLLLANSRRSGRFPHQSGWIAVISKMLCIVPLLLGAWQETRTVRILAFRHYTEQALHPLRYVTVQLVSTTTTTLGGQTTHPQGIMTNTIVEAIGGEIRIGEELSQFQETIKTWFYTCFCLGTMAFAILYYLSFTLLQWIFVTWKERQKRRRRYDEEFDFDIDLDDNFEDVGSFDNDHDDDWRDVGLDNDMHRNHEENRPGEEEPMQGDNDPSIRNAHDRTPEVQEVAERNAETHREHGDVSTTNACSQGQERYSHILHASRINDIEESDDENWEDLKIVPDAREEPILSILQPISIAGCLGRQILPHSPNTPHLREMTDEELSQTLSRGMYSDGENGSSNNDRHPFLFFLFGR